MTAETEGGTGATTIASPGTTDAPAVTTGNGSSAAEPEPVCVAGETRCDGADALETCAADESLWESMACPAGSQCVPCEDETCEADRCLSRCEQHLQSGATSAGCSFLAARQLGLSEILGPLFNVDEEDWSPDGLLLLNPTDVTATVQLHDLAQGSTTPEPLGEPLVLAPDTAEIVDLQTPLPLGGISIRRIGSMTWVESDVPIVAYSYSPTDPFVGNDSSMLLPESSLGLHYVVPSYPPHYLQFQGAGYPTYFDVLATAPETEVRWLAQFAPTSGTGIPINPVAAGDWSETFTVGRFEGVRVMASGAAVVDQHDADVSGILVEATAPVYVIGGSRCSAVPAVDTPDAGCDPLTEALVPVEQWGQTYVVNHPPLRESEDHYYRIYGGDEGITVTAPQAVLPGGEYVFASRGDYVDVTVPNGTNFLATADGPIMVVGYLASRDVAGSIGDPAMYQLISFEQADTRYALGAPAKWDQQFVQLTREAAGADVTIDDTLVADWQTIGAYETSTVLLEEGVHILASDSPFAAIQFGYNNSEGDACDPYDSASICHSSYAHPVGMRNAELFSP